LSCRSRACFIKRFGAVLDKVEEVKVSRPETSENLRILLIEDNHHDQIAFRRAFKMADGDSEMAVDITMCARAEEALARLAEVPSEAETRADAVDFDLIVADHKLPGMSGLDLCKTLLAQDVPVPLVILTGRGSEALAVEALKAGVEDYIIKDPERGYLALLPVVLWDVVRKYDDRLARERAEAALAKQAEELARSNADLEQFAYVVSHDLQEPLRMVVGYLGLLERRFEDALDPDMRTFINYAVDGAKRMQTMIKGLLEYARVGTQQRDLDRVDCEVLVTEVLNDMQFIIQQEGAVVTRTSLPTVNADALQLRRVFQNLITNALKFQPLPSEGTTRTEPPRIHIAAKRRAVADHPQMAWCFSVKDNGVGIVPESMAYIFQIFQRAHSREAYEGTGIGLAVCKKIIEGHGGRIWVESEVGKGSTFYFTLPAHQEEGI
jgi:signal transduction histidine kinase